MFIRAKLCLASKLNTIAIDLHRAKPLNNTDLEIGTACGQHHFMRL